MTAAEEVQALKQRHHAMSSSSSRPEKSQPLEAELRALAARFYRDGAVEQSFWVITGDVNS